MKKYNPITAGDLLSLEEFEKNRAVLRQKMISLKKKRRVPLGPDVTFYFENRDTLLWQIQEMLFIEKGGKDQIEDELRAYNPLVPKGSELVATMMIEIEDMVRRRLTLQQLGEIEKHISFQIGEEIIRGIPEDDVERTDASGKTSAVHFLHFPMTEEQKDKFMTALSITLQITHPRYTYTTALDPETHGVLKEDL